MASDANPPDTTFLYSKIVNLQYDQQDITLQHPDDYHEGPYPRPKIKFGCTSSTQSIVFEATISNPNDDIEVTITNGFQGFVDPTGPQAIVELNVERADGVTNLDTLQDRQLTITWALIPQSAKQKEPKDLCAELHKSVQKKTDVFNIKWDREGPHWSSSSQSLDVTLCGTDSSDLELFICARCET